MVLTVVCMNRWVGLAKEKRKIGVWDFKDLMYRRRGMQLKNNNNKKIFWLISPDEKRNDTMYAV